MQGAHMRAMRVAMELSQSELAEELGVTTSTVWRWENGYMRITERAAKALRTLAKFKGVWI